jgi:hypothetical protein
MAETAPACLTGRLGPIGVEIFYSLAEPISRSCANRPNHCRENLQTPEIAAALKTAEIVTILYQNVVIGRR